MQADPLATQTSVGKIISFLRNMNGWQVVSFVSMAAGPFYAVIVPFQLAFDLHVDFSVIYVTSYTVDVIVCAVCAISLRALQKTKVSKNRHGTSTLRAPFCSWVFSRAKRKILTHLVFCTPWDLAFWMLNDFTDYIPYVRLLRLLYGVPAVFATIGKFEVESSFLSYSKARALRLTMLIVLVTHFLACTFFWFTRLAGAQHYLTAP